MTLFGELVSINWTYAKLTHPQAKSDHSENCFSSLDVSIDTSYSDKTVFTRPYLPWERAILRKSSKSGAAEGFTKRYNVHELVYYEETDDVSTAISREKQLKNWQRAWKIALIEKDNSQWNDLSDLL